MKAMMIHQAQRPGTQEPVDSGDGTDRQETATLRVVAGWCRARYNAAAVSTGRNPQAAGELSWRSKGRGRQRVTVLTA